MYGLWVEIRENYMSMNVKIKDTLHTIRYNIIQDIEYMEMIEYAK